jgi:hypothetical protein
MVKFRLNMEFRGKAKVGSVLFIDGVCETEDKETIAFLDGVPHVTRVEDKKKASPKKKKEPTTEVKDNG